MTDLIHLSFFGDLKENSIYDQKITEKLKPGLRGGTQDRVSLSKIVFKCRTHV